MKFYDYKTCYDYVHAAGIIDRRMTADDYCRLAAERWAQIAETHSDDRINTVVCRNQLLIEQDWHRARKPYYNVWPRMAEPLCRVDLGQVLCDRVQLSPMHVAM